MIGGLLENMLPKYGMLPAGCWGTPFNLYLQLASIHNRVKTRIAEGVRL